MFCDFWVTYLFSLILVIVVPELKGSSVVVEEPLHHAVVGSHVLVQDHGQVHKLQIEPIESLSE